MHIYMFDFNVYRCIYLTIAEKGAQVCWEILRHGFFHYLFAVAARRKFDRLIQ